MGLEVLFMDVLILWLVVGTTIVVLIIVISIVAYYRSRK